MIPKVTLSRSGLTTSRLAFGTSRLHYLDPKRRQELLSIAAELGLMHFDTAPLYGDGLAEREIGRFVRGQRDRFVIATKYGNPPDALIEAVPLLATPLRGVRAVGKRLGLSGPKRPPITAQGLRSSVEASLKRLNTVWLDIVMLHEPSLQRLASPDDVLAEFISLRQRGLIRHFGLAGKWSDIDGLGDNAPALGEVVQTAESEWPEKSPPDITYSALSQSAQTYFANAVDAEGATSRLQQALSRRPHGVVIVSTTKPENLRRLAAAVTAQLRLGSRQE